MSENKQTKEDLIKERDLLISELKNIGVQDETTGKWAAVPEKMEENQPDPNLTADRFEDYESRVSVLDVLQERLRKVEEELKALE